MGHERVGALPKTRRWRDIVQRMAGFNGQASETAEIASCTARNVQSRFRNMGRDSGVHAAFEFLLALASACQGTERKRHLRDLGVDLDASPSPLSMAASLGRWVNNNRGSLEYASLAQAAATDAIAEWFRKHKTGQRHLFNATPKSSEIWAQAGTGSGFCELARSFFANLTRRYLNYFLEREASAACQGIGARNLFQESMKEHVDEVSQHAFEMSKITQSFAAGWYNKHAKAKPPHREMVAGFLGMAFGKMREELLREVK